MSSGNEPGPVGSERSTAIRTLAVDAQARELFEEFEAIGLQPVLLKGGTLADWLYGGDGVRSYGDVDLLIDPGRVADAQERLRELGFETGPGVTPPDTPHARAWRRAGDGAVIDLHWTVSGSCLSPRSTFELLLPHTRSAALGGGSVRALDTVAALLLIVLHASQHAEGKPLLDLQRALQRVSPEEWTQASALAERLQAGYGFSRGLRLLPEGRELADQLGLPPERLFEASTVASSALVLGLERLATTRGARARVRLLISELFPSPAFMRWRFPVARRGRRGLGAAYAWRLVWLSRRLIPSVRAWWRLRSRAA